MKIFEVDYLFTRTFEQDHSEELHLYKKLNINIELVKLFYLS